MKRPPTNLYASAESIRGDIIILTDSEFHHLVHVLRLEPGDEAMIVDGSGNIYRARLSGRDKREARFEIEEKSRGDDLEPARELVLAQGLVRRDEFSEILSGCTQVGVSEFIPFQADRSVVKSRALSGSSTLSRWNLVLISAIKQCGRAYLPRISSPVGLKELLERSARFDLRLVAYESAAQPLSEVWEGGAGGGGSVLVVVGPEAGFSDPEIESFMSTRFRTFSLGRRRLRSRTAAVLAAGILSDLIGSRG
jgi:16S rRNA (uracil1498-N3)-methyltransferase